MLLHIMVSQNPKKLIFKKNSYDVMLEYMCVKNIYSTSHDTKKCKYIQEMIEMIFYEICNIHQTL